MTASTHPNQPLSPAIRGLLMLTALFNTVFGLMFLLGPETGINLWVTPVPPVLARFVGAIIIANGVGAGLAARQGTWQGARALFSVALVYGAIVLAALLYHLLFLSAPPVLWGYVLSDLIFLAPILAIFWKYELRQELKAVGSPQKAAGSRQ